MEQEDGDHGCYRDTAQLPGHGPEQGSRDNGVATYRVEAAVVAIAPMVLLAGFVYHPYISPSYG